MSVNIIPIDDKTILIERTGLVTKEQLIRGYSQVLEMDIEYAIFDDTNMMVHSNNVIDNEEVQALSKAILQQETFKHVIFVLPEESDRRQFGTEIFERLDASDKMSFATSMEAARQRLSELRK